MQPQQLSNCRSSVAVTRQSVSEQLADRRHTSSVADPAARCRRRQVELVPQRRLCQSSPASRRTGTRRQLRRDVTAQWSDVIRR